MKTNTIYFEDLRRGLDNIFATKEQLHTAKIACNTLMKRIKTAWNNNTITTDEYYSVYNWLVKAKAQLH